MTSSGNQMVDAREERGTLKVATVSILLDVMVNVPADADWCDPSPLEDAVDHVLREEYGDLLLDATSVDIDDVRDVV